METQHPEPTHPLYQILHDELDRVQEIWETLSSNVEALTARKKHFGDDLTMERREADVRLQRAMDTWDSLEGYMNFIEHAIWAIETYDEGAGDKELLPTLIGVNPSRLRYWGVEYPFPYVEGQWKND